MNSIQDFSNFTLNYYRNPDHHRLLDALEYGARTLSVNNAFDETTLGTSLYFFALLARKDSTLVGHYQTVRSRLEEERARRFIDKILWLSDNDHNTPPPEILPPHVPLEFDVLDRSARTASDLDYLWTEFSATGNADAVRRVLEVLAWPDRIRLRLEHWLCEPTGSIVTRFRRRWIARRIQRATGIECDVDRGVIITKGDLDCWCLIGPNAEREVAARFPVVRAALPFTLHEQEVAFIGVKGAACWSAMSLRPYHPTVDTVWREVMGELPNKPLQRPALPVAES